MLHNNDEWLNLVYLLAVLLLILSGGYGQRLRALTMEKKVQYAVLWLGIVLALVALHDYLHSGP